MKQFNTTSLIQTTYSHITSSPRKRRSSLKMDSRLRGNDNREHENDSNCRVEYCNEYVKNTKRLTSKLPIDLCLEKGIITKDEHSAALTLRRLYYLFFGDRILKSNSPSISSKKTLVLSIKSESKAYSALLAILKRLREKNFYQSILDLCIFDIEPRFLQNPQDIRLHPQLSHFKEGIDDLCKTLTC